MLEQFQNIKLKKVKRPQLDFITFNKNLVKEIKINELEEYQYIFFRVTQFLYDNKNELKSRNVYGRVTEIRPKAIQINYTSWFPKSQINEVYKRKEKIQTKLMKFYEE